MNDLISRQAAIDAIDAVFPVDPMRNDYTQGITCGAALAEEYIKQLPSAQPTIEAEPVRRGRWERCGIKTYDFAFYCSECCSFSPNGIKTKYCPWCGAEMVD